MHLFPGLSKHGGILLKTRDWQERLVRRGLPPAFHFTFLLAASLTRTGPWLHKRAGGIKMISAVVLLNLLHEFNRPATGGFGLERRGSRATCGGLDTLSDRRSLGRLWITPREAGKIELLLPLAE
jgi:hypothetical protein